MSLGRHGVGVTPGVELRPGRVAHDPSVVHDGGAVDQDVVNAHALGIEPPCAAREVLAHSLGLGSRPCRDRRSRCRRHSRLRSAPAHAGRRAGRGRRSAVPRPPRGRSRRTPARRGPAPRWNRWRRTSCRGGHPRPSPRRRSADRARRRPGASTPAPPWGRWRVAARCAARRRRRCRRARRRGRHPARRRSPRSCDLRCARFASLVTSTTCRRDQLARRRSTPVSEAAPSLRRRRTWGSERARIRSATGSLITGPQPGRPSSAKPERKERRIPMLWGSVRATTRPPWAAA